MSIETTPHHVNLSVSQNAFNVRRFFVSMILLLAPLMVWLSTTGNPVEYFRYDLPPGQALYVFCKLVGLYAVMLLWLQAICGLLRLNTQCTNYLPNWSVSSHRLLGFVVLGIAAAHITMFVTAASIRKKMFMKDLLLPDFSHGYYNSMVSVGVMASYVMVMIILIALLRQWIGRLWIWGHRFSILLFALVFVHSIMIGSETRTHVWEVFYAGCLLTFMAAGWRRLSHLKSQTASQP